ncbi:kinesin-like protein KIF20B isoform X1 [Macrosteles quadrilineatus]|uniref:kinesin-like protein KIF20B isoform X1 n=1 Tax=Macrosteles quadrilineatus TaxID=74068 RepID=UPI0023E0CBD7|nr:kinesin-like protein KIF20B isoform X1 [Macrosteles quadrilineatus]
MANKKAALENSLQERTQLEKKVADKDKKIKELIAEINLLQPKKTLCENKKLSDHKSNVELMKNLVSGADRRNVQIQEFRKKINRLEHMIRDKSNREEKLLSYATKLTKKCNNKCSSFNNQIKELQSSEKTLRNQVSELERVLGQKTLELHQRERLVKELKELIRLKNEWEVSLWKCRKRDDNCKLLSEESTPSLKTIEVFNLLALKHMEIIKLDRRISGLQNIQNEDWKSGKEVIQANKADIRELGMLIDDARINSKKQKTTYFL